MKTYIAEKGKTFVDANGVNYGTVVETNNIELLTQVDVKTEITTLRELADMQKQCIEERKLRNQKYQEYLKSKEVKESSETKTE